MSRVAPFGSWPSPFEIDLLTKGAIVFGEVGAAGGARWWLEGRAEEGGRQVLVRRDRDGTEERLTPEGFNARSRVHEYGGGAIVVDGDIVVVSDFTTGRLHRVTSPGVLAPLTSADHAWRFADLSVDRPRNRLLAIREDHDPETRARHGEAENAIVAIDLADGAVTVLAMGSDFFAAPRLSPDGRRMCWLRWDHPNLPWDGTELVVADVDAAGRLADERVVAGSRADWIAQPRWSPAGVLHFAAEPDGWMNLFRLGDDDRIQRVTVPIEAEFAYPDWIFGIANYTFTADGSIVAVGRDGGRDRLYRIGSDGRAEPIDLPFTEIGFVAVDRDRAVFRAAASDLPWAIVELDLASNARTILKGSTALAFEPATVSIGEHVEFPTEGDRTSFGILYRPVNPESGGPTGELPPLIVTSHGGPTAQASTAFSILVQLFTSRGFAVLDVDYGGSTGYGSDYRKRLEGEWGVVDLADCVAGARWLAEQGIVDGRRLAIRGGSASGYTTLCAVTFSDAFTAGASYFGIGDLESFMAQTHKFESRYLDRLIGPYPERKDLYHDRSPLNFADRISCPVLILQGAEDRIVPPAQAEEIVDALWERHLPHAYVLFPGEDHGFRSAAHIIRAFESELSFYGQVFGFTPADPIDPIEVAFLGVTSLVVLLLVGLMLAATVAAIAARRFGIPYPVLLVVGGLAIGFIPGLPNIELPPDVVFLLFLPPILFAAGYFTSIRDVRANLRAILLLAVGLVLFTMVVVGAVTRALVPAMPWAAALTLGAIVAPPDAVAATAVFQRLGVPRRIVTILEGESLLNDATALVAYRFAVVAAMTGSFSLLDAGTTFVVAAVGGIAIGLVVGGATTWGVARVNDPVFSIVLTFIAPLVAYLVANELQLSGVLATVVAGVYLGRKAARRMSSEVRLAGLATWQILLFLINGAVFILIGLQLPQVLGGLDEFTPGQLTGLAIVVSATVVLARIVWVFPATYLPRRFSRKIRERDPAPPVRLVVLVSWAGMRGVVSLAAALALPIDFPERNLVIFLTFAVILATLVGQGLTLPWLVRRLGIEDGGGSVEREEAYARLMMADAATGRLDELAAQWPGHLELIDNLRAGFEHQSRHDRVRKHPEERDEAAELELIEHREIRMSVLDAERESLLMMRERGAISDEVHRVVERDLDLEELRMEV